MAGTKKQPITAASLAETIAAELVALDSIAAATVVNTYTDPGVVSVVEVRTQGGARFRVAVAVEHVEAVPDD
jgi:hypothetical protein